MSTINRLIYAACVLITLVFAVRVFADPLTDNERQEMPYKNALAGKNPGFENGKASWTASGGTLATVTSGGNFQGIGRASGTWDSSGSGQTLTSSAYTIPNGLATSNFLARCRVMTPSGTATHTMGLWDGSTLTQTVSIPSSAVAQYVDIPFISGAATSTIAIRFTSVNANEPLVSIDDCYLGQNYNIQSVSQSSFIGSAYYATTTNCSGWSRTNTALGAFSTDSDCPAPTIEYNPGPGAIQAVDNDLPQLTINDLPPGYYTVIASIPATKDGTANSGTFALYDGTTTSGRASSNNIANGNGNSTVVGSFYYTAAGNRTFQIYGAAGSGAIQIENGSGQRQLEFRIFRSPINAEITTRAEAYGWLVDANISGANPSLGTSAQTAYVGIEDSGLTLTNNASPNALSAQIPCSSTNASSGTTCSAGNESVGVAFVLPAPGEVKACVEFAHQIVLSTSGVLNATFQIVETSNTAQTVVTEGKARIQSGLSTASTSVVHPNQVCGYFNFTTAGQKTLRLMYEQAVTATITTNTLLADAGASNGQRDIHWTVYPLSQGFPAPVYVGAVTSQTTGQERIERATITNSGSPTVGSQSGAWISSLTDNGTGDTTINIAAGVFSSAPTCVCNSHGTTLRICTVNTATAPSATAYRVLTTNGSATAVDENFSITCMGPK